VYNVLRELADGAVMLVGDCTRIRCSFLLVESQRIGQVEADRTPEMVGAAYHDMVIHDGREDRGIGNRVGALA